MYQGVTMHSRHLPAVVSQKSISSQRHTQSSPSIMDATCRISYKSSLIILVKLFKLSSLPSAYDSQLEHQPVLSWVIFPVCCPLQHFSKFFTKFDCCLITPATSRRSLSVSLSLVISSNLVNKALWASALAYLTLALLLSVCVSVHTSGYFSNKANKTCFCTSLSASITASATSSAFKSVLELLSYVNRLFTRNFDSKQ